MAKMSFTEIEATVVEKVEKPVVAETPKVEAPAEAPKAAETKAVAVVQESTPAVATADEDYQGYDSQPKRLMLPYLTLVNTSGKLGGTFPGGTYVFNKETLLNTKPDEPVEITVLGVDEYFKEVIPNEEFGTRFGQIARTEAEVIAQGGTFIYEQKDKMQLWAKAATVVLLVKKPEKELPDEQDVLFYLELNGSRYAAAQWGLEKGKYTKIVPVIKSARATWAKGKNPEHYHTAKFKLTSYLERGKQSNWFTPIIKPGGKNSEETVDLITEALTTMQAAS